MEYAKHMATPPHFQSMPRKKPKAAGYTSPRDGAPGAMGAA